MTDDGRDTAYSARQAYQNYAASVAYGKTSRLAGPLTLYRRRVERRAITELLVRVPQGSTVLDCPCGNGRWFDLLAGRAGRIIGVDISAAMLQRARARATELDIDVDLIEGEVENLPLGDESVDFTFSFALTKHLPWPLQRRVLAEFARVSRRGLICSFSVLTPISYALWRRRGLVGSFPVSREQLDWMAGQVGLRTALMVRCSTPVGVERLVLYDKHAHGGDAAG